MVQPIHLALQAAVAAVTLVAAATDLHSRIIPNWLVVVGFLAGFGLNTWYGGWDGLVSALFGFGLALLIYIPLFILRAMGGGDVKLMAAVGCMVGPHNWFMVFIFASLLGGVFAICLILFRNAAGGTLWNMFHILKELIRLRLPFKSKPELDIGHSKALTMPHGLSIAAGTLMFLFSDYL
jgi:prepilin peptidase CpaA